MESNKKSHPPRHDFTVAFYALYFGLLALLFIRVFILRQDVIASLDLAVLFLAVSILSLAQMHRQGTWPAIWDEYGKLLYGKHFVDTIISTFFFTFIMVGAGFWSLDSPGGVFGTVVGATVYAVLWWFLPVLVKHWRKK